MKVRSPPPEMANVSQTLILFLCLILLHYTAAVCHSGMGAALPTVHRSTFCSVRPSNNPDAERICGCYNSILRTQSNGLINVTHDGSFALGCKFGFWAPSNLKINVQYLEWSNTVSVTLSHCYSDSIVTYGNDDYCYNNELKYYGLMTQKNIPIADSRYYEIDIRDSASPMSFIAWWTTVPTSITCANCPAGKKSDNEDLCSFCLPGTYSPVGGQSTCSNCPSGKYFGSYAGTACQDCPAGKVAITEGLTACQDCPTGKVAFDNACVNTNPCLPGFFYLAFVCNHCFIGTYQDQRNALRCYDCQAGKYSDRQGSTSCVNCESGKYSTTKKASSSLTCLSCPSGTFSETGATSCIANPPPPPPPPSPPPPPPAPEPPPPPPSPPPPPREPLPHPREARVSNIYNIIVYIVIILLIITY